MSSEKTFTDQGLAGANRARPGLGEALAACRDVDTPIVTKLDRLARSLSDAKDIVNDLTRREFKLSISGSVHDPTDLVGRLLFNVMAMVSVHRAGTHATMELAGLFAVARSTVYRAIKRAGDAA